MNRISCLFIAALAVCVLLACGKKDENEDKAAQAEPTATGDVAGKTAGAAKVAEKAVQDDRPPLTAEEYEKLLLDLATCEVQNDHIDPKCPARRTWTEARTRKNALKEVAGMSLELGKKHIRHESPAVRVQAASFLGSLFGADQGSLSMILEVARAEKEPAVIAAILQTVGSKGGKFPEVGKLLLDMADHESPIVRKKAVVWLGSSWNSELVGSIDKLIEKVEKDPDQEVRLFACRYSGPRGDDKMVATYAKHTKDPAADPPLYQACMEGLFNSWMQYPNFQTHNEKAYKLTLERLRYTPRGKDNPPWTLMDNFAELAKEGNQAVGKWKQQATWFKPADVLAVLGPIVSDTAANRLARTGALKSMVALGATKKQLEAIKAAIKDPDDIENKNVIQALDQAIAQAQ